MTSQAPRGPYDAVVAGAGHHGLTAAAYLARAGLGTLALALLAAVPPPGSAPPPPVPYGVRVQDTAVAMPDGVRLAANVFLPEGARGEERFPAILEYLPYRHTRAVAPGQALLTRAGAPASLEEPPLHTFVRHGYAGVRVDVRGTGRSEGVTPDREYSEEEQADGVEVIAWIARQPWCDGNVGMWGVSWGGFNSLQMAARQPPALKAIIAMHATEDLFQDDIHYVDGLFHYDEYELSMDVANALTRAPDFPTDQASLAQRFDQPPWSLIYKRHQRDGPFWRRASQSPPYERLRAPVLLIGGWLDGYRDSVPRLLEHLKTPVKAIVGPWNHDHPDASLPGPRIDWRREALRWWDRWLKGQRNGVEDGPKLAAFIRRWHPPGPGLRVLPGEWRLEEGWPPRRLRPWTLHLQADRTLAPGASAPVTHHLRYVPSAGVVSGFWWGELVPDQRPADAFSLVYDSAPLAEDVEILGLPRVALRASADAPLAHWFARLSDVAPDGQVTLVTGAGLNGAHRESATNPRPLTPGQAERIEIEMHFTSWVFPKGHRIRLAVSNALWPMIWPTPHAMTTSLYVGAEASSRLVLPVMPFEPRPTPDFVTVPMGQPQAAGTWPGRYRTIRDDVRQATRVEWSGESESTAPWGRVFDRERLTYEVEDARPESASIRGEAEQEVHLPGRVLSWKAFLELVSDRERFRYRLRRQLSENGRVVRERTWEEAIPRDHQ
ncbi:MAG TPA: CocE/NonD family hydrolase [Vicinamibacteria bacterium]|nr:CocE/NonD family hydrolase [Vicinamibacteria bacterium]